MERGARSVSVFEYTVILVLDRKPHLKLDILADFQSIAAIERGRSQGWDQGGNATVLTRDPRLKVA